MRETAYDSDADEEFAEIVLQQATDLFFIATELEEDPTDETSLRIMNMGITELAYALFVQSEDKAAMYSPFSSERIGSYSYSKVANALMKAEMTGIPMFDLAVQYFRGGADGGDGVITMRAEDVFAQPYLDFEPTNRDALFRHLLDESSTPYGR
jgi:hypothetical protein